MALYKHMYISTH